MLRAKWFVVMVVMLAAVAAQADIVINEIMQNPSAVSDSYGEYFEVYNDGVADVDMDGWTVSDLDTESFVISGTALVTAGGYFVFGVNDTLAINGGVPVDYMYPNNFYLSNSADELVLTDVGLVVQDQVEWDNGVTFPDPNGASMQLIDPALDNNVGANWAEANLPYGDGDFGTPGAANEFATVPLVINEIMQNPSIVSDSFGEFVEIYNPGAFDVDLDGYTLADLDSDSHLIVGTVIVPAGGYAVLGVNDDMLLNGGVPVDYMYSSFFLSNSADEVYLYDGGMAVVDGVSYDGGAIWPDPTGASMQCIDNTLDNDDGLNWLEADLPYGDGDMGTPGAFNEWDPGNPPDDTLFVSIADIQADPSLYTEPWIWVAVDGIVTQGHDTIHDYYVDVFVQDESGYGIMMYASDTLFGEGLERGDEIDIIAQVDQYFDTTELVDFIWTELSTGNPQPDPLVFDTGVFDASIAFEGTWCEMTGEITSEPDAIGDYNFTIDDGTGDGTIRIYAAAGFDMTQYAIGDFITVRGTMDTFGGTAQLQPSELGDIETVVNDPVVLNLTVTSDTVPAAGGIIYYDAHLVSYVGGSYAVSYSSEALAPNANTYTVDAGIPFTLTPFMDASFTGLSINVPGVAPEGTYTFTGGVGAGQYFFSDSFDFYKTGVIAGEWNGELGGSESLIASDDATVTELPTSFEMGTAYPNPFNPTTTVAISLPENAELTINVFNVTGQTVATLVNGQVAAGQHNFVFDGQNLSSGIYFIQASVAGQMNEIQKVTLMK
jgi:Lamin Tail Domain/Secretion system C-terminal sorting domain